MTTAINSDNPLVIAWPASPVPQPTLQALEAVLGGFLDESERIVWCAQPDAQSIKDLEASKSTAWWAPVLIGAGILGYVAYGMMGQAKSLIEDPMNVMNFWMPLVIGVVTLGIGIVSLTSPGRSRSGARYTLYAITNERAILLEPGQIPGPKQKTMHWKFTAVHRSALRDVQSKRLPGRTELQDVVWTFYQPLTDLEIKALHQRGEMAVEPTVKTGFFGVPAETDVEALLRNLRSGNL
jgi:hypothetical protein